MCVVAARTRDDGLVGDGFFHGAKELDLLRVAQAWRLAGGARDDHSVRAVGDEHRGELGGRAVIDLPILPEGSHHRRQESSYLFHAFTAPSAPNSIACS